jgi:hypothetical protein
MPRRGRRCALFDFVALRSQCLSLLDAQDDWTPLHYAANKGQLEVARRLLESGADKEVKEKVCAPPQGPSAAGAVPLRPHSTEETATLSCVRWRAG